MAQGQGQGSGLGSRPKAQGSVKTFDHMLQILPEP
jgi:hypothetical protein